MAAKLTGRPGCWIDSFVKEEETFAIHVWLDHCLGSLICSWLVLVIMVAGARAGIRSLYILKYTIFAMLA